MAQVGIRLTDEEFAVLTRRAKAVEGDFPELQGTMTEGKVAAYAVRQHIKQLQEEENKALSTDV